MHQSGGWRGWREGWRAGFILRAYNIYTYFPNYIAKHYVFGDFLDFEFSVFVASVARCLSDNPANQPARQPATQPTSQPGSQPPSQPARQPAQTFKLFKLSNFETFQTLKLSNVHTFQTFKLSNFQTFPIIHRGPLTLIP